MALPSPGTGSTRAETPQPHPANASTAQLLGVGAGLFGGAGPVAVLGLLGEEDVQQAAPRLPGETIGSLGTDVTTLKERVQR
ncbi:hypothetical protein [Modestobacter sp. I12A-02662]|uniref:hypothetical protein n=1 Tax=Modestobacter sp. I12A-02662 TaxID=1730496 RepID=UPI0034DFE0BD